MRITEMINLLETFRQELGDVEVTITDGYNAHCYRGAYAIEPWQEDDGRDAVDIGIGGCEE